MNESFQAVLLIGAMVWASSNLAPFFGHLVPMLGGFLSDRPVLAGLLLAAFVWRFTTSAKTS